MTKLYITATPIGNLEDISLRALRILKEVDFILCEDTRVTKKLLNKYEIKTPTISYHSFSGKIKTDKILELLEEEKDLALVSDAGTPTISDPGFQLVSQVRKKFGEKVEILPIPGASALSSALSVSGLPSDTFIFYGFLPHKKGKQSIINEILESKRTSVFYESPHRVLKTLKMIQELSIKNESNPKHSVGQGKEIVIARELTKMFEQVVAGNIGKVSEYFENNPDKVKGEFVIIISGN
ncbi:MAG: 16S rRNA (cytidine(1402)-2'-O)-methyltransferase [Candidatus Pacebacteria bacterium]|nr:16S rRNA (cytidine(1402)-2'-O)-methyltransferase [Candidatus Paceibacterota bacterium]